MKHKIPLILVFLLFAYTASAHEHSNPIIETSDWHDVTSDTLTEQILMERPLLGRLDRYGDSDTFLIEFLENQATQMVHVDVPKCGTFHMPFYPTLSLFPLDDGAIDSTPPTDYTQSPLPITERTPQSTETPLEFHERLSWEITVAEAGTYRLAIREPDGHLGAYALSLGETLLEPEQLQQFRTVWLQSNCDTPLSSESCPLPNWYMEADAPPPDDFPQRWQLGTDYSLDGIIRDHETCLPVSDATVYFYYANPDGDYDDDHRGVTYSNQQGAFRIETTLPGIYGGGPAHIHFHIVAPDYSFMVFAHNLEANETEASVMFPLIPLMDD